MTSRTVGNTAENRRIDSWKEIAAFFGRDERTVKRWEKERGLPVHRLPGERGGVFAWSSELTAWLNSAAANGKVDDPPPASPALIPPPESKSPEPSAPPAPDEKATPASPHFTNRWIWAAVVVVALAAALFYAFRFERRSFREHSNITVLHPATHHVPDPEAQEFYLKGRYYWNRRTDASLHQAIDAFTQAVVHDNNNARAYAGLAETYDLLPEYGKMSNADAYPRAIAAANRAIALDPSLAEAHRALAFALFYWNWDVNGALSQFHLALQLDPQDFETHHWLATTLLTLGRGPESVAEIQRARELQPSSRSILADQALIHFVFHHDPAESIATLRELERTDPDFVVAPRYLANIFHDEHDYADFIPEATRAADISHDASLAAVMQEASDGWHKDGVHGMLLSMKKTQEQLYAKGNLAPFELARTCALLGDKPCALHYLQAAFAAHDYMMLTIMSGYFNDLLKDEPEFRQLQASVRQRMNQSS